MRPLQGQTILLTRPRSQSAGISAGLERLGARVLAAPAIRTVPPASWKGLDRALRGLSRYPIIVFTSANGVESFFFRARTVLGREPDSPPRLCAIGPATAKALRGHGWRAAEVPAVHEASALAKAMGSVRGSDILIPRAEKAREILPRMLRRAGARVRVVKAYRT
ncbi:MAG: uroporphyrinogen-III synthase, partial [Elusimicrobiota bacterium]